MTEASPFEAACRTACLLDQVDPDELVRLSGDRKQIAQPMPFGLPDEYGSPRWKAYEHEVHRLNAILEALSKWRQKRIDDEIAEERSEELIAEMARREERARIISMLWGRQSQWIKGAFVQNHFASATVAKELAAIIDLINPPAPAGPQEPLL